jgi:hypothetical protein
MMQVNEMPLILERLEGQHRWRYKRARSKQDVGVPGLIDDLFLEVFTFRLPDLGGWEPQPPALQRRFHRRSMGEKTFLIAPDAAFC